METPLYKHTGIIRSIRINRGYDEGMGRDVFMNFSVGQPIKKLDIVITRIEEDQHDAVIFGVKRYNLFARKTNSEVEKLWYSYDSMPCEVGYDIND